MHISLLWTCLASLVAAVALGACDACDGNGTDQATQGTDAMGTTAMTTHGTPDTMATSSPTSTSGSTTDVPTPTTGTSQSTVELMTDATTMTSNEPSTGTVSMSETDASSGSNTTGGSLDMGSACGPPGEPEFSYIWIANTLQGTVSKIDTQTLKEVGRYLVHPDGGKGDPSRTSVSLSGAVAVANRAGGLTKVHARLADCIESNGIPGIQTSTDSNFLSWNIEECRAWYTPMNYTSQRAVAWTPGTYDKNSCTYEAQKVWTAGANDPLEPGVVVHRVDGSTGSVEDTVKVPDVNAAFYGIYGAAVDAKGNFWGSQIGFGDLLYVDAQTLQYKKWPMGGPSPTGGYGMTVGASGYVWICNQKVSRFDPLTETWKIASVDGSGGCMEDDSGTLYMSGGNSSIIALDVETLEVKQNLLVPTYVHGIGIDFHGFVWGVTLSSSAYRVDPEDGTYETFEGLTAAYTLSDMTGFALYNVLSP